MANTQEPHRKRLKQADCRRLPRSEDTQQKNRALELIAKAISLYSLKNQALEYPKLPDQDSHVKAPTSSSGDAIVTALRNLGPAKPKDLAQATGLSVPTVQRRLRALVDDGHATKQGSTRSTRYQLTART